MTRAEKGWGVRVGPIMEVGWARRKQGRGGEGRWERADSVDRASQWGGGVIGVCAGTLKAMSGKNGAVLGLVGGVVAAVAGSARCREQSQFSRIPPGCCSPALG